MSAPQKTLAVLASKAPLRTRPSLYPEPFASKMASREKRSLGSIFGLSNFGVNHVTLAPGGVSALRHAHATQDEFVYIISGQPTLVTNAGETLLQPGMCAGFKAGDGDAHCLVNQTNEDVVYLEIGDRSPSDRVLYPDDDIEAVLTPDGQWQFNHKDGVPY